MGDGPFRIEFFEDEAGNKPVLRWLREDLTPAKRRAVGKAMQHVLERQGVDVCESEFGRALGEGLFEFRLRYGLSELLRRFEDVEPPDDEAKEDIVLRVFFHPYGDRLILLLHGYDKAKDPSPRRQSKEIKEARRRLRAWQQAQAKAKKEEAKNRRA